MSRMKTIDYVRDYQLEPGDFPYSLSKENFTRFYETLKSVPLVGIELEYDIDSYFDFCAIEEYVTEASNYANLPVVKVGEFSLYAEYAIEFNTAPSPLYQQLKFVKALYRDEGFYREIFSKQVIHRKTGLHFHFSVPDLVSRHENIVDGCTDFSTSWLKSNEALVVLAFIANSLEINTDSIASEAIHRDFNYFTEERYVDLYKRPLDLALYSGLLQLKTYKVKEPFLFLSHTAEWRAPRTPLSYKEFLQSLALLLLMIHFANRYGKEIIANADADHINKETYEKEIEDSFLKFFSKRFHSYVNALYNIRFE